VRRFGLSLLLVAACSTRKPENSAPTAEPKPTTVAEPAKPTSPPAPTAPAAECAITVELVADKVRLSGGPLKPTDVPRVAGASPDLAQLEAHSGICAANIRAAPETSYRDVILVMERVHRIGIKDIWLGDHAKPPASTSRRWPPKGVSPGEPFEDLQPTPPIIVITTADVQVGGQTIGTVGSPFGRALTAALPPNPADPTIILQADPGLTYATIDEAIDATHAAGYTAVAFAVPAGITPPHSR
jgi:biopolymer transport protein ExbD